MTTARWPLNVLRAGPVAAGATLWRSRGQLHVTVIAKATFAMVAGGEAQRIEPLEVIRSEVYTRGHPMKPLLAASELAPWLERAEVVLTGHAWAPGGVPVRRMPVRLAILRGAAALVDKRLEVVGDRTATAASPDPEPEPFVKMPIEYQRAWGGDIRDPENPFGVGAIQDTRGRTSLPNLLPPGGGRAPIGLGPIPPMVPSRASRLRGLARTALEGVASIPDDFDWLYFQSAPADQRFDRVLGGEQIVLEGLSPRHPVLTTRLPALRALATIYLPNGAQRWLLLVGDTLIVHPDAERCAVVFRGSFQVALEEALSALRVAVGVEAGGQPVPWPEATEVLASAPVEAAAAERVKSGDWSSTVTLDDDDDVDAPESAVGEHPLAGTMPLDDAALSPGVEARPREAQAASSPAAALRAQGRGGTAGAPFPLAPAGAHGARSSGEHADAPWAVSRVTAIPVAASPLESTIDLSATVDAPLEGAIDRRAPAGAPLEDTIDLRVPASAPAPVAAPAPAPAPAPVDAPAPAPASARLPTPEREPQAERSPGPRSPATAPSAPKQQRPDLLGSLYKRFRKG
ncbi:DUF2169 family type VI secretion system accessory protein [Sorangium sp. So ce1389]|uniref:DUF2169 family type VI secretion system accessory protein n=1 Tax=Sorangium sp. So ce1389 TaxID=3133336 RepID=UPI003F63D942